MHKLFHRETRKNKLSKHKIGKIAPRHPVWNETGRGGLRSSFSNEDKRPRLRSGTRSPTSFHGSWPSLASESTSECARKHGKINDTPDTDGGEGRGGGWRVWRLSASSNGGGGGGGEGGNTNRRNSFATFHSAARPLPHPELHSLSIISPRQATPCASPPSPQLVSCERTLSSLEDIASSCPPNERFCYQLQSFALFIFFRQKKSGIRIFALVSFDVFNCRGNWNRKRNFNEPAFRLEPFSVIFSVIRKKVKYTQKIRSRFRSKSQPHGIEQSFLNLFCTRTSPYGRHDIRSTVALLVCRIFYCYIYVYLHLHSEYTCNTITFYIRV